MLQNKILLAMVALRVFFGLLGLVGAVLMLLRQDLATALRINTALGSIGPFVFLSVSLLGISGLASEMQPSRLALVVVGVICVLLGTR